MSIQRFRSREPEIEAIQWTEDNEEELREFTNKSFYFLDPEDREDDPDQTAAVFCNFRWEGVYPGDWIIRDEQKEIRLMRKEDFEKEYDPV